MALYHRLALDGTVWSPEHSPPLRRCRCRSGHLHHRGLLLPLYELLTFLLIITWVQAADELKNPFRTNPGYDVDLVAKLHINLWKSSLMLQNQQEMLHNNKEGGILKSDLKE